MQNKRLPIIEGEEAKEETEQGPKRRISHVIEPTLDNNNQPIKREVSFRPVTTTTWT